MICLSASLPTGAAIGDGGHKDMQMSACAAAFARLDLIPCFRVISAQIFPARISQQGLPNWALMGHPERKARRIDEGGRPTGVVTLAA
jgi:hypothetical protein